MTAAAEPVSILCVCTHNRTRSVMMAALLREHAGSRGLDVSVTTAGLGPPGLPATDDTVTRLARLGIDVSGHRSHPVDRDGIRCAGLVLTAEVDHVVAVTGRVDDAFDRTFTLPEFVQRARGAGPRAGRPLAEWLAEVGEGRPRAIDYLGAPIGELEDPTGQSSERWRRSLREIDALAEGAVELLS